MNNNQHDRYVNASVSMMETMASQAAQQGGISDMGAAAFAAISTNVMQAETVQASAALTHLDNVLSDIRDRYAASTAEVFERRGISK